MSPRKILKICPPEIESGAVFTENYITVAKRCASAGHLYTEYCTNTGK